MRNRIYTAFLIIILYSTLAYSFDMSNVVAYPVPFNPRAGVLTIGYPAHATLTGYNIKTVIFDINGDIVTEKTRSQLPLKWNGRAENGRVVKPGLYILKVTVENDDGDFGKKIIRILVDY